MERRRTSQQPGQARGANLLRILIFLLFLSWSGEAVALRPKKPGPRYIYNYYATRVGRLSFVGVRFDGGREPTEGSSFLIGDTLVVTANHLVPRLANYETHQITVTLPNRPPIPVALVARDPANDLAVLRLESAPMPLQPACPIEAITALRQDMIGSNVTVLSYPVGLELGPTPGVLGPPDQRGRWRTEAGMDPGSSGGPVFLSDEGYLVGIAVAGVRWTERNGRLLPVQSVNEFLPASALVSGSLKSLIETDSRCWTVGELPSLDASDIVVTGSAASATAGAGLGGIPLAIAKFIVAPINFVFKSDRTDGPSDLTTYVPVEVAETVATAGSSRRDIPLQAEAGYTILRCTPRAREAFGSNTRCDLAPDGRTGVLHIEPDPQAVGDRYWTGTVVLQQRERR